MTSGFFGIWRQSLDRTQSVFALHNVSKETVTLPVSTLNIIADEDWRDLLSGDPISKNDVVLAPYQCPLDQQRRSLILFHVRKRGSPAYRKRRKSGSAA